MMTIELPDQVISTLLWQGTEHADNGDMDVYSGDENDTEHVPDDIRSEIAKPWSLFIIEAQRLIGLAQEGMAEFSRWSDITNVAQDWVLSSFGHGTGFWDRYSGTSRYARLGTALDELTKLHRCPEVSWLLYEDERGEVWFM